MKAVFLISCLVLFLVPITFVLHDVYEEGVFGRAGLLGIAFAAATFLLEWAFGDNGVAVQPQVVLLTASFALFLSWHLFRFHRRVLRQTEDRAPVAVGP